MMRTDWNIQRNLSLNFKPHPLARNTHFQTIASSLRKTDAPRLLSASREMILEVDGDVRLQGFYSPQPGGTSEGVVLILHGWLGHVNAPYLLAMGEQLYRQGFAIFRLHYRDHGGTQQLNPGIFRGDLLDEIFAAAQRIGTFEPERPLHVIGMSLGGSFALRIAWRHARQPIPNMGHTVAINPSINPYHTTLALDNGPHIYLAYFRRKWRQAFKAKQMAFPEIYRDISAVIAAPTTMLMTEAFVPFSPYNSAREYLDSYAVTPAMLAELTSPVTVIASEDDPVVPIDDFYPLVNISPRLNLSIQRYGGHVGFIDIFPFRYWINEAVFAILANSSFRGRITA